MVGYNNKLLIDSEMIKFPVHLSSSCLQNFHEEVEEALGTANLDESV